MRWVRTRDLRRFRWLFGLSGCRRRKTQDNRERQRNSQWKLSHFETPPRIRISSLGFSFGDHTPREFDEVKTNSNFAPLYSVTPAKTVPTVAGFIGRNSYFAGAAASLSIVWKFSSSSQNCSARVHFGFNT